MALNYQKTIENNIPEHLRKNNTENLIKSFVETYNNVELDITTLLNATFIKTASGLYLDDIGKLFKLMRADNESDDTYRSRIQSYYQAFLLGGSATGIKKVVSLLTGIPESYITVTDTATLKITVDISLGATYDAATLNLLTETINLVKPVGVYLQAITQSSQNNLFRINISKINGTNIII